MPSAIRLIRFNSLRIFLAMSALGWGVCLVGVFAPGSMAFDFLGRLADIDSAPFRNDPMFDYWLRMASSVFALIGMGYLGLAIWPRRFANVMPFAGMFMILEGLILLVHGLRLSLPPVPFIGDTLFCLAAGSGILFCMGSSSSNSNQERRHPDPGRSREEGEANR